MFDLFKRNNSVIAPISGRVLDLSQVPDEVFAGKLAGDGIAIDCSGDTIVSPVDGIISLIFKTNHAFGITVDNGVEFLVHIGIDTVQLEGEGFERLAKEGAKVKAGDPIIRINREFIKEKGYSLVSPVLITNMDKIKEIKSNIDGEVTAGEHTVFTYKVK